MDFPVVLDSKSKTPVFLQVARALRERILSGQLKPGSRLPSTREMGETLGISRATVVKSYDDLLSQGLIEATPGGRTCVSRRLRTGAGEDPARRRATPIAHADLDGRISAESRQMMDLTLSYATSADRPELNYGSPPLDMLPARQWKEVLLEHCRAQSPAAFDYSPDPFGYPALRESIAGYLSRAKALNCAAEQIVVFPGSQQALNYTCRLLIDQGDAVVVENPGYTGARDNFLARGARLVPVDVDEDGLTVSALYELDRPPKLVYVTPGHHDPSGAIMSLARRRQLVDWASRHDVTIVEDAWDGDYRYVSPSLPALQGLDTNGRVIYIYSFWKVLYPLSAVGCLVLPPPLVPLFERARLLAERQFPMLEHYALNDFIAEGHLERHIKKTRAVYARRRQALISALSRNFRAAVTIPKQSAGLHLTVRFAAELQGSDIAYLAGQAGLPLTATAQYYLHSSRAGEFLIPFALLPEHDIGAAVDRLADLLARH